MVVLLYSLPDDYDMFVANLLHHDVDLLIVPFHISTDASRQEIRLKLANVRKTGTSAILLHSQNRDYIARILETVSILLDSTVNLFSSVWSCQVWGHTPSPRPP